MLHFSDYIPIIKQHMSVKVFNGRVEQSEKRISDLENRIMEFIESEEQEDKQLEKIQQCLRNLWDTIKHTNIHIMGVLEGGEREIEVERTFEEIMAENFPSLMKDMNINI